MSHHHIVNAVFNSPWALHRPWFGSMFSLLHSKMFAGEQAGHVEALAAPRVLARDALLIEGDLVAGRGRSGGGRFGVFRHGWDRTGRLVNHSARIHALAARRAETTADFLDIVAEEEATLEAGQILHIFGSGVLGKHLSSMDEMCSGGLSVDRVQAALKLAHSDDKVAGVMLHLDTPGGICYGMAETAALVRQIKEAKLTGFFCDSLTASAGVWCVCCADVGYITPSCDFGSIGVYSAVVDYTEWCKNEGIKVTLIADGTFKGAGYPGTAMSPEQLAKIESDVKQCSAAFKADVRAGRAGVTDDTMQGQCFIGQSAVDAKLADHVVNDLDAALSDFAQAI